MLIFINPRAIQKALNNLQNLLAFPFPPWVPLIPRQKLPARFSPGGGEKMPIDPANFLLDMILPLSYIRLIRKQFLSLNPPIFQTRIRSIYREGETGMQVGLGAE
jgi:hypothetical protein